MILNLQSDYEIKRSKVKVTRSHNAQMRVSLSSLSENSEKVVVFNVLILGSLHDSFCINCPDQ